MITTDLRELRSMTSKAGDVRENELNKRITQSYSEHALVNVFDTFSHGRTCNLDL